MFIHYYYFVEERMKEFVEFHKSDEFDLLFRNQYSEEIITKIKNFYLNERDFQCDEISKLQNICHVSTYTYKLHVYYLPSVVLVINLYGKRNIVGVIFYLFTQSRPIRIYD